MHTNASASLCIFFCARVKKEAGRDQCGVCPGQCGCCCTIKSRQFSSVQQASMKPEVRPGKFARARSGARLSQSGWRQTLTHPPSVHTNKHTETRRVSLPLCPFFLLSLGSCSKCLALGTFTSPKPNHSPSCTFSRSTHQIP